MTLADATILPLALKDVSFAAGGKRLIKDATCVFTPGLCTAVIGPNGAGKSLLLRLCHGLIRPSGGEVVWEGAAGRDPRPHQAMVFQRPVMLRRSATANIEYALSLRGVAPRLRREIAQDALDRTGLKRFARHPARVLSGGEQQRLALARAWALKPQVLFLDEPTASLDPAATHSVEEIVAAFRAAGTRVILTTHDLGQARRLADEVVFMHRGRILEKAPARNFFAGPENDLAQAFLKGELLWWRLGRDNRRPPKHQRTEDRP
ncbi:MAG: phosphate ABC transporter ATP-binding protein [Alphaproteobacteria bacterium]|nr:phosphate ABC transporter ATP-binding protein [Alphaproteobacteria bacterium]